MRIVQPVLDFHFLKALNFCQGANTLTYIYDWLNQKHIQ